MSKYVWSFLFWVVLPGITANVIVLGGQPWFARVTSIIAGMILASMLWGVATHKGRTEAYQARKSEEQERQRQEYEEIRRGNHRVFFFSLFNKIAKGWSPSINSIELLLDRQGDVRVYFLNLAKELRSFLGTDYAKHVFHPDDQPRVHLVGVGGTSWHSYHLVFVDGVQLWRIMEEHADYFLLGDIAGKTVSVTVPLFEEDDRILELLKFATKYTSVADYTLETIAAWGKPVLLESKASKEDQNLGRLRVALDLGERGELFEPGFTVDQVFADLLRRDPLKLEHLRQKK